MEIKSVFILPNVNDRRYWTAAASWKSSFGQGLSNTIWSYAIDKKMAIFH